jgi:hypothetical protein
MTFYVSRNTSYFVFCLFATHTGNTLTLCARQQQRMRATGHPFPHFLFDWQNSRSHSPIRFCRRQQQQWLRLWRRQVLIVNKEFASHVPQPQKRESEKRQRNRTRSFILTMLSFDLRNDMITFAVRTPLHSGDHLFHILTPD